jgi:hypothetical protein
MSRSAFARSKRSSDEPISWNAHRLRQDLVDGHARVQGRERVLEHELDGAAVGFQRRAFQAVDVARSGSVVEHDLAGIRLHRARDDLGDRGLAAARLADKAEVLPAGSEVDVRDGAEWLFCR